VVTPRDARAATQTSDEARAWCQVQLDERGLVRRRI